MTDNVTLGTGDPATPVAGTQIATDNIGGINYQRVKMTWGADGTAFDADVASGSALPIQLRNSTGIEIATASNPLRIDPTGTTAQPVTNAGTFAVQAAQSGPWNIANISGTITLPTGAATAAKQPALGTAGVASPDVISVQGVASMVALKVDGSGVTQPASQSGNWTARVVGNGGSTLDAAIGAGSAPVNMIAVGGIYNSTEISPTTGQSAAIQLDSKGRQRMVLMDAAGNTRGANINASNQLSVSIDAASASNISTNVAQMNGVAVTMGNGVTGTGVQRVTLSSDSTGQVGLAAGTNLAGKFGIDQTTIGTTNGVTAVPATSGGLTIYRLLSAATTNGNNIKASAGQLYGFVITNTNAAARFVKLYNKASSPTVGTDTPVITLVIPGNATGSGMVAADFSTGIPFSLGLSIAITGAVADADTTAVAANEVVVNLFYK